jgi:hypothetical protein
MITKQHNSQLTAHDAKILALVAVMLFTCSQKTFAQQWNTNGNDISNANSGNVGIGTTSPAQKLEISSVLPLIQMSDTGTGGIKLTMGSVGGYSVFGANRNFATGAHYYTGKTTASYFIFVGNGNSFHGWSTTPTNNAEPAERMRLDKDGNLGIGTSTPTSASGYTALSLNNSTTGTLLDFMTNNTVKARLQSDGTVFYFNNLANGPIQIYTNSAERMRIAAGGNVGIGTTNTAYARLQVNRSIRIDDDSGSATGSDTVDSASNLYIGTSAGGGSFQFNGTGGIDLWQFNSGWGRTVTFAKSGNVGIGTPSPQYTLDVAGNINSNATITGNNVVARYQDVAEWVPAEEQLPTGTVVVLDRTKANQVVASTKAYDTRVAGVISAQPGIILGERSDNKVLVATTGRVRIKVDATNAPIEIGDLLVTSNKEGVAMKSLPIEFGGVQIHRPGTLIGKALEPLPKGSGEILVLLSLQ